MGAAKPQSNLSKYQRFEPRRINRCDIKNAPYNPRTIGPAERKRLKASLKANGLVETLVWNERTGNLVGGHQRIGILDELEGRDDYDLDVAVVDVDLRQEQNLNLALNNRNIQGDWDDDMVADLLRDRDGDELKAIGVTDLDLQVLLGDTDEGVNALLNDGPERSETKEKLADIKQDRKAMNERLRQENSADFYCVLVFETAEEKGEFYRAVGQPLGDVYLRAAVVTQKLV